MDHRSVHRDFFSGPIHGNNTSTSISAATIFEDNHDDDDDNIMDLEWPFGDLGLDDDAIREAAYEIFFTACRSSPGFGGRSNNHNHGNADERGNESHGSGSSNGSGRVYGVVTKPTSKVKKALGLKMLKRSPSRRMSSFSTGIGGSGGGVSMSSSFISHGHGNNFGSGMQWRSQK